MAVYVTLHLYTEVDRYIKCTCKKASQTCCRKKAHIQNTIVNIEIVIFFPLANLFMYENAYWKVLRWFLLLLLSHIIHIKRERKKSSFWLFVFFFYTLFITQKKPCAGSVLQFRQNRAKKVEKIGFFFTTLKY